MQKQVSYRRLAHALLQGKSYFGLALRALQGMPIRHKYFFPIVKIIAESKPGPMSILEVGSWAGASAVSWAKALRKLDRPGRVLCVDHWRPYFDLQTDSGHHYAEMDEAAQTGDIFRLFLHNIRAEGIEAMIDYRIGDSRAILPSLSSAYDVVYIDGSHRFPDVLSDIQHAKRLVPDGVICGDDLEVYKHEIDEREHEQLLRAGCDYAYSAKAQRHYHPGVTEAVAREFPTVSLWEGFWAVTRSGSHWRQIELQDPGRLEIPPHILSSIDGETIAEHGETTLFNLLEIEGRFLAISKEIGKVDVLSERLGERELWPIVLEATTLDEVRAKAQQVERTASRPTPEPSGEGWGFNFVRMGEAYLAVAKSLGPTDLLLERLGERDLCPLIFRGETLEEVVKKAKAARI